MIYLDSSILTRSMLIDERGHEHAQSILDRTDHLLVTGSWSRVEVSAALTRAARANRGDQSLLLETFDQLISPRSGQVTVIDSEQAEVELIANALVRQYGLRSLDAWHLACAQLASEILPEGGEEFFFATRDAEQSIVADALGFTVL